VPEIKRKYVIPGEVVAEGNVRADLNVMRVNDQLIATRVGMAEIGHDVVRVIPLSGPYIPRIDDLVVGKVIDYSAFAWEADINSCFFGILPAASVFGRDYSPAKDSLTDKLKVGDMIAARVIAYDRSRDPLLSISGSGLGRIPRGQVAKISPAKVPRLIGKKGSMIKTIEAGTKSRMLIGQNGVVVIVGSPDDTIRAIRAVHLVEEEAHSADLTERVQNLLGMTVEQREEAREESGEDKAPQEVSSEATPETQEHKTDQPEMESADQTPSGM
jgi:exosome complex component RRP4